ncbi:MAG: hypothetical protein ACI8RC_001719, partial [Ilumatobacter sp.]
MPEASAGATPDSVLTEPSTTLDVATTIASVAPLTGWQAVDRYLEITLIRGGSSAASIAVMRNGGLEHSQAF